MELQAPQRNKDSLYNNMNKAKKNIEHVTNNRASEKIKNSQQRVTSRGCFSLLIFFTLLIGMVTLFILSAVYFNSVTGELTKFNMSHEGNLSFMQNDVALQLKGIICLVIAVSILVGLIPATIASKKGYNFDEYWLFGSILFIIALPVSLLLKPKEEYLLNDLTTCPFCAESVKKVAILCKHCGRDLPKN